MFDSIFEEEVSEKLESSSVIFENSLELRTQIETSGYRIDLGVYNPVKSKYILGIEYDGATYHSSKSAREGIFIDKFLESKG